MADYDEIDAMKKIDEAMKPLDEPAQLRALQWANSKYGGKRTVGGSFSSHDQPELEKAKPDAPGEFGTFPELFEATAPSSEKDRALVAAYWTQVCTGAGSFASLSLNSELKDMGHGVSNITETLTRLKDERPALVLQLKKSGTSKQARKIYKLTQEGIRRVQLMIANRAHSEILD